MSTDAWGDTCTQRLHRTSKGSKEWRQRRWCNQTVLVFTGKQLLITCVLCSGQRFIHYIGTSIRLNKKLALKQLCPCIVFLLLLFLLVLQCVGYAHSVWHRKLSPSQGWELVLLTAGGLCWCRLSDQASPTLLILVWLLLFLWILLSVAGTREIHSSGI